jgi:hypothetical protein
MLLEWRNTDAQAPERNGTGGAFDDTDLTWNMVPWSRFGARIKASDTISARMEFGSGTGGDTGVTLRQLYGEWNLGKWSILLGHEYTPAFFIASTSVSADAAQLGYGGFYVGRQDQVKFKFGRFQIALIEPSTTNPGLYGATQDTDTTIPKIEGRWSGDLGPVFLSISAGYNTVDMCSTVTDQEESVDSYVANLGLRYNIGAFALAGQIWIASNGPEYGMSTVAAGAQINAAGTGVADTDSMGFVISGKYKINDMWSIGAGYGWTEASYDVPGMQDDDTTSYYVNAPMTLAKGVSLTPEFAIFDYGDGTAGQDEGKSTAFTIWWGIFF